MPELHAYLVEDNPHLCEGLVNTMQELAGVRVIGTSPTPAEAAAWLIHHPFDWDLLVIDLYLRGGNGLHLVEPLAARQPWQKIIFFSNYMTAPIRKRCAQLGVDAVFDKSSELDALIDYCTRQGSGKGLSAADGESLVRQHGLTPTPTTPRG